MYAPKRTFTAKAPDDYMIEPLVWSAYPVVDLVLEIRLSSARP